MNSLDFIVQYANNIKTDSIKIMEIRGVENKHDTNIDISSILPKNINLLKEFCDVRYIVNKKEIDKLLLILERYNNVMIVSFEELLKIKGTKKSLLDYKENGYDVRRIISLIDCIELAKKYPNKKIILFSAGFEATTPIVALLIKKITNKNIKNVYIYSVLKNISAFIENSLRNNKNIIDGIICPQNIATIMGSKYLSFVYENYGLPIVFSKGAPVDRIIALKKIIDMKTKEDKKFISNYINNYSGENSLAKLLIEEVFEIRDYYSEGFNNILGLSYHIKEKYKKYDARIEFNVGDNVTRLKKEDLLIHYSKLKKVNKELQACNHSSFVSENISNNAFELLELNCN